MFDADENALPLLLADTLTLVVPNGHEIVEPGDVPQPPDHERRVSEQPFGSENPSWSAVSVAPSGELPLTVVAADPRNTGSVFCADARASARPYPNTLSGTTSLTCAAFLTIKSRSVVRAVPASSADGPPATRHGAACSTSAAMPATCGAAADVPKNGFSNRPAAVTLTPSIAEISGFSRPSTVGPRLLKNSIVWLLRSRHDSSGAALPENTDAAAADAEQIAPTEMTLAGDPPASLSAVTLRVAVLKLCRSCRGGASGRGPVAAHSGVNEYRFRLFAAARLPTFWTTIRN